MGVHRFDYWVDSGLILVDLVWGSHPVMLRGVSLWNHAVPGIEPRPPTCKACAPVHCAEFLAFLFILKTPHFGGYAKSRVVGTLAPV